MRHETNEDFLAAYESFLEKNLTEKEDLLLYGAGCEVCETCAEGCVDPYDHDICDTPSFSYHACDLCESSLGGDRHPAHLHKKDKIFHLRICTDCLFFLANSVLPFDES